MRLHEFQAKRLLVEYGLPIPRGVVALTPDEAEAIARDLGAQRIAVKAQIHAGERLQAGGVRIVHGPSMARAAAADLIGQRLVTAQTDEGGETVRRVYVEEGVTAERSLHLALLIDPASGGLVAVGSAGGGEGVEERARRGELKQEKVALSVSGPADRTEVAAFLQKIGLDGPSNEAGVDLVEGLRRAFVELDASLIEINPLAVLPSGELKALDVKMQVDDNALFRHPDLASLRDEDDANRIKLSAHRDQLNFVQLDGDIGLVSNGAGLGLATLDMVKAAGGRPANFMDVRTTARSLDIAHGFILLLDNPSIKTLLINVHGGGMQSCDTIAEGLGIALRRSGRKVPIVVRLAGQNAELGRYRLKSFGCSVIEAPDMGAAAERAVAVAAGRA
ncbi:ADP-forming succinate--CoA ligase subunit beta [Hansschlegelia zhihuaiae]|uniref:ADP-forming succinate--CoA ligase subunit beta n=1 Tax=Hansschlegelia zhihuaiae TaxID=405005 RepID=A0A4V1KHN5_9HYPH|nr:ADP-forming succinate--CoA ligase subunit beta [Hansschlegelia zhihuaiae]RXF67812.1 ADP-forming succinate--CoA ligase subunit beta [Hansschlegelia zhihuaiae]